MTYEESLAYISGLESRGWKLGLERTTAFLNALGLESFLRGDERPKYIHVAGTNGKGSTTAYVQAALVGAGLRTGAFFSPFVVDPRERVQLDRDLISCDRFAELVSMIRPVAESFEASEFGPITEFEFKTAVGFCAWEQAKVEAVALEVGLGGRLDSTNVIDPACSIIVSIGLDHMHILGDTVEKIAFEKAGIVKPGRPLVLGTVPPSARRVILEVAEAAEAPVWEFGREIRMEGENLVTPAGRVGPVRPSMVGVHQLHNCALALAALQRADIPITTEVLAAIETAFAPGRFEVHTIRGKTVVFDGAHNEDSGKALAETMRQRFPGKRFAMVTGMLRGHEVTDFYPAFWGQAADVFVSPIDNPRARDTVELESELMELGFAARACESPEDAMNRAIASNAELIVVTGSFYLVGDLLAKFARS